MAPAVLSAYAVSFRAGRETFILVTLHVDYGDSSGERLPELVNSYGQNLIALGDFNIDRHNDELWKAFTSTGLTVPAQLHAVKRSIFAVESDPLLNKYYDQVAWFETGNHRKLAMEFVNAGGFDFVPFIYTELGMPKSSLQHRLSDHYPLWVEFNCRD